MGNLAVKTKKKFAYTWTQVLLLGKFLKETNSSVCNLPKRI